MPDRSSPGTVSHTGNTGLAALRAASHPVSAVDLFDDEDPLFPSAPPPFSGIRLPDARTLAWAEYGNPRGLPCVVIPDAGSSRLAPTWLLHDAAVPATIRLLAVDRPGLGASDPVGIGGREDLPDDLQHMVETLAVGRVAVIGVGHGVDDALAFADRFPGLVTAVIGVSARTAAVIPEQPGNHRLFRHRRQAWDGPLLAWARAAGRADLARELTWRRALDRMSPDAAEALGERWREPDFRAAVAADLALGQPERAPRTPPPTRTPRWTQRWSAPLPVHLWHGRQEWATHVSAIREVAGHRPGWDVIAVPGCSALLGFWPEILLQALQSFGTAPAFGTASALEAATSTGAVTASDSATSSGAAREQPDAAPDDDPADHQPIAANPADAQPIVANRADAQPIVAARIDNTSGRLDATSAKLSPPSRLAYTVPERVPK